MAPNHLEQSPPPEYTEHCTEGPASAVSATPQPGLDNDDLPDQASKKRKETGGTKVIDWRGTALHNKQKLSESRGKVLKLRGFLNERDKTIAQMKSDKKTALETIKSAHHRDIKRHQDTYNKSVAAHIEKDKKQKDEILGHQEEINGYEWRIMELEKHFNYKHSDATRENRMYKRFNPDSKDWDLGLCRVRFVLGDNCHVQGCEYRYKPLTQEEQKYMRFLQPKGPEFLEAVAKANVKDRKKVLL
ncbi:hypothetical protein E8E11_007046 [Didymella keratinophila]|nr:hypothetical protein E8E11_007046 [Didymella keratinophila]